MSDDKAQEVVKFVVNDKPVAADLLYFNDPQYGMRVWTRGGPDTGSRQRRP